MTPRSMDLMDSESQAMDSASLLPADGRRLAWMSRLHSSPVHPLDDEDLLQEILLRLPPQPSSLPRASLVCPRWHCILSDPKFIQRFRRHHRKPPLLGFFFSETGFPTVFNPALDPPDRIPAERFSLPKNRFNASQHFLGCRHGLAVLTNLHLREIIVWDPLSGQQHRVGFPAGLDNNKVTYWHAELLCADAEDGHVHGDCFSSPFKLVAIWVVRCTQAFACLYESATGVWGDTVFTEVTKQNYNYSMRPGVLIGNALCWLLSGGDVLAFCLQSQSLHVMNKPLEIKYTSGSIQLLRTEDCGVGLAYLSELTIQLWERKSNCHGVVGWVLLQKTIQLQELFPQGMFSERKRVHITGYAEETNAIVLSVLRDDFMLQVDTMEIKHIQKRKGDGFTFPYANFYVAGMQVDGGDIGDENWDVVDELMHYLGVPAHLDVDEF
ncbi:hypothetical protein CFC21_090756 [Triticum aestivum]|uniref:Uncharacterized protein n=5 Tax=Triticinae TaxID=1648030 RepID=A0A453MPK7_AEGTS|nr:hypothetical protein CFC21_090756 [Triticum aestivum]